MTAFFAMLRRDLALALRQGSDVALVATFFVLAATLFPFGVGPEPNLLARMSSGVIWATALLAAMLSLDRLFLQDYEDGSLELAALSSAPLPMLVLAKATAHWLTTGAPLVALTPLLAVLLNAPDDSILPLTISLALGAPSLSLFGAVGAALTLGARRGGPLAPLLVVPLVLPVLIFGVGAVEASVTGVGANAHFMILAAILIASAPLAPLAAALALRQALE